MTSSEAAPEQQAAQAAAPSDPGARLVAGRYRLGERLGHGGMGIVWAARDELLARPVAVKEVRLPSSVDPEERAQLRERTLREARTAARLDHPCAVRMFDVCEEDEQAFLVMELVDGRSLSDVIREDGPIAPARAAEIGVCLLDALTAAHAAGIVHRDVKPGNVLVRPDGRVTLTDFGIASTAGDPSITSTGLLLGSPAYIAPERARGGSPEPESDLWSLGATLFTAVEGRPPFDHDDPLATLTAVVTDAHEPCHRAGPALAGILDRLLDKEPQHRPDPATLRQLLQSVAADPNARIALPPTAAPPVEPHTGGHTIAISPTDAEGGSAAGGPSVVARVLAYVALCAVMFAAAFALVAVIRAG